MSATPDIIPTDLTLEIGDDPSPERFMKAAHAFFGYISEISKMVAEGERQGWVVRIREGSNLLGVAPASATPTPWHRSVTARARRGYQDMTQGRIDSSGLSEPAIRHLNTLSEMASGPRDRPTFIRMWFERQPEQVDATIAGVVREDERLGYRDFGTVEGILDTVQDRNGLQLRINDVALHQTVKCYVSEQLLMDALSKFRKRVEVSGVIRYRKDGRALSINAEKIDQLPEDSELPTWEDVRAIFRASA